jgi:GMP synthase (glutamine-hydrolysing)
MIEEIKARDLNTDKFIAEKVKEITAAVGEDTAINALSGGVDSSVVTMIGHRALGKKLRTVFIQNGLMREGEPETVAGYFKKLGVIVEIVDAKKDLLNALLGQRRCQDCHTNSSTF